MASSGRRDGPAVEHGDEADAGQPESSEAVRIVRASESERDALIERYGLVGQIEREIAAELAAFRPLADPDGFPEAHSRAMYAIEVLDRNGARPAAVPRVGPLTPIASFVVGLIARWIVRGHQARLIGDMRQLYGRREAISEPMSVEHRLLRRARFHATHPTSRDTATTRWVCRHSSSGAPCSRRWHPAPKLPH